MRKSILLLLVSFMSIATYAQFKDVMVIHKNDNSTVSIPTDDIKNITFDQQFETTVTTGEAEEFGDDSYRLFGTFTGDLDVIDLLLSENDKSPGFFISTSGIPSSTNYTQNVHYYMVASDEPVSNLNLFMGYAEDLTPGTTYYYRAYAWFNGVYYYGETKSFTTPGEAAPLTIEIQWLGIDAIVVVNNETLAGDVTIGAMYGSTSNLNETNCNWCVNPYSANWKPEPKRRAYYFLYDNLIPNTTYYHRGYVWHDGKYYLSPVQSFKTDDVAAKTVDATDIKATSAKLSGSIIGAYGAELTAGIIYGTSSNLSATNGTKKSTTSSGSYTVSLTGLSANTTYYYRAYILYNGEYILGEVKSFKTRTYIVGDNYPNDDYPQGIVWKVSSGGTSGMILSTDGGFGSWSAAKTWCQNKGTGWSLPTKEQLITISNNYSKLYLTGFYWSSSLYASGLENMYYLVCLGYWSGYSAGTIIYQSESNSNSYFAVKAF